MSVLHPGRAAIASKGWWRAHRWLVLRRISQLGILGLFLLGPWAGYWIVKGNLASSLTLGVLPMSDPYVLLQSFLAGHAIAATALLGAGIVVVLYLLVGGRAYCAWVCPMNMVTDLAGLLRRRLQLKGTSRMSRQVRYWMLGMTLLLALASGTIAWEVINPVSMLSRGLIFGMGFAWAIVLAVFLFDLLVMRQGWCGHVCPVGAFYSLLGTGSVVRVAATGRERCDDCMDCFAVCPEPQVIRPALKGAEQGRGPVITSPNCTNCGRCIDVCAPNVFRYATRFHNATTPPIRVAQNKEVSS